MAHILQVSCYGSNILYFSGWGSDMPANVWVYRRNKKNIVSIGTYESQL